MGKVEIDLDELLFRLGVAGKSNPPRKGTTKGEPKPKAKPKRKASAYHKKYSKAFLKLAPRFKKKNGQWKKDGFKRCAAAARREAKK